MTLPPLSDLACAKCGGQDIGWKHREAGGSVPYGCRAWYDHNLRCTERIEKYCRRCGYEWAEAPLSPSEEPSDA